jgi:hypothetical protein
MRGIDRRVLCRSPGISLAVLSLCLLAQTGCSRSVVGHWKMKSVSPNREMFCMDNVEFRRDGSYAARCTIDGRTRDEEGQYIFNGYKLKLRPRAGGQRSFSAALRIGTLEVTDGDRRVVLKKVKG